MRALVIGRGSMGQRRIRDLRALGVEVESWDITDGTLEPVGGHFDAIVVSTPPLTKRRFGAGMLLSPRLSAINANERAARPLDADVATPLFTVEWRRRPRETVAAHSAAPIFTEADIEQVPYPHYPSATPRFLPAIVRTKERVERGEIGTPVAYTLHVGQHLADWHPGADLSLYYAAKRKTGACREMVPFELGWLSWVFGAVTKAKALRGSLAGIADIDDVYQVVLQHQVKGSAPVLGHLLIDAVSRPARRHVNIVGTLGTIDTDLRFTESAYKAEMRAFIASVEEGAPWPYSLEEERANLDMLHTIEAAS